MTRRINPEDLKDPSLISSKLYRDYIDGNFWQYPSRVRAVVVDIDYTGGQFEQEPPNPRCSIKARIITLGMDSYLDDEDLTIFWPADSHNIPPVKRGEHVFVSFEDYDNLEDGYWHCRAPEPLPTFNLNYVDGVEKYKKNGLNDDSNVDLYSAVQKTPDKAVQYRPSEIFVVEDVPDLILREGDYAFKGSNNTSIVLGRDRIDSVETGNRNKAGTIDIVAGLNSDNPNFDDDLSRIYVSMNTNVDENFGINIGNSALNTPAIVTKSDEIRILARKGTKIIVEGGDLHIEGQNIFLGEAATESVLQGNLFQQLWTRLMSVIATHTHPAPIPVSPSPQLAPLATPTFSDLGPTTGILSTTVKVKG